MFLRYLEEEEGLQVIRNSGGFIGFRLVDEELYISKVFVDEECRGFECFKDLFSKAIEVGIDMGCSYVTGNIKLMDAERDSKKTMMFLRYGFSPVQAINNVITFHKLLETGE